VEKFRKAGRQSFLQSTAPDDAARDVLLNLSDREQSTKELESSGIMKEFRRITADPDWGALSSCRIRPSLMGMRNSP